MSRSRVKVAAVSERLPQGTLRPQTPAEGTGPKPESRTVGRPRKAPGAKAKGVTVTLWPHEFEALEDLRARVNDGLPAAVPRSDLARLAFSLLLEMSPQDVRAALSKLRK